MPTASLGEGLAAVAITGAAPRPRRGAHAPRRDASRGFLRLRHQYSARNTFYLPSPERARGAFRSVLTSSQIRIDGVQHNVELLLEAEKLLRA